MMSKVRSFDQSEVTWPKWYHLIQLRSFDQRGVKSDVIWPRDTIWSKPHRSVKKWCHSTKVISFDQTDIIWSKVSNVMSPDQTDIMRSNWHHLIKAVSKPLLLDQSNVSKLKKPIRASFKSEFWGDHISVILVNQLSNKQKTITKTLWTQTSMTLKCLFLVGWVWAKYQNN